MEKHIGSYLVNGENAFKHGIPGLIVDVVMRTPAGRRLQPRECFRVQWKDEKEDFVPVHPESAYSIISAEEAMVILER